MKTEILNAVLMFLKDTLNIDVVIVFVFYTTNDFNKSVTNSA